MTMLIDYYYLLVIFVSTVLAVTYGVRCVVIVLVVLE
jgi:hypothetical protein